MGSILEPIFKANGVSKPHHQIHHTTLTQDMTAMPQDNTFQVDDGTVVEPIFAGPPTLMGHVFWN